MSEKAVSFTSLKDVPESTWTNLSKKRIFFGHQSVGHNIVNGIYDIMKKHPAIRLNIVETIDPTEFNAPLLAHARIGKNRNPQSKIDAFSNLMERGVGDKADLAFFKFCYVDISHTTDTDRLFTKYKKAMSHLMKTYPNITFMHVTVPLVSKETGLKPFVKKILGRQVRDHEENMKRTSFNQMMREEYSGKEAIFDLEEIESTLPDGTRLFTKKGDKTIFLLASDYTDDGGHLNRLGRQIAAKQLLLNLAHLFQ